MKSLGGNLSSLCLSFLTHSYTILGREGATVFKPKTPHPGRSKPPKCCTSFSTALLKPARGRREHLPRSCPTRGGTQGLGPNWVEGTGEDHSTQHRQHPAFPSANQLAWTTPGARNRPATLTRGRTVAQNPAPAPPAAALVGRREDDSGHAYLPSGPNLTAPSPPRPLHCACARSRGAGWEVSVVSWLHRRLGYLLRCSGVCRGFWMSLLLQLLFHPSWASQHYRPPTQNFPAAALRRIPATSQLATSLTLLTPPLLLCTWHYASSMYCVTLIPSATDSETEKVKNLLKVTYPKMCWSLKFIAGCLPHFHLTWRNNRTPSQVSYAIHKFSLSLKSCEGSIISTAEDSSVTCPRTPAQLWWQYLGHTWPLCFSTLF